MERFDKSGGSSSDDLWCIYYTGDRSKPVLDFLERWLVRASPPIRRKIDVILTEWGIPHDSPPPGWAAKSAGELVPADQVRSRFHFDRTPSPGSDPKLSSYFTAPSEVYLAPAGLFALPTRTLELSEAELLARVHGGDRIAQAESAVTLTRRHQHIPECTRVLVARIASDLSEGWKRTNGLFSDGGGGKLAFLSGTSSPREGRQAFPADEITYHALEWIVRFGGTSALRALAEMFDDDRVREQTTLLLLGCGTDPPFLQIDSARERLLLPSLARHSMHPDDQARKAWERCLGMALNYLPGGADWAFHQGRWFHQQPDIDDEVATTLLQVLEYRTTLEDGHNTPGVDLVDQIAWIGLRSPLVRTRWTPRLEAWIDRHDEVGLEALRALCHWGVSDDHIARRYIDAVDSIGDPAGNSLEKVPCLTAHTPETRKALERLFHRAENKELLLPRLASGGILDCRTDELARECADWCTNNSEDPWWGLLENRFLALPEIRTSDSKADRIAKAGIRLRTLQRSSQEWSGSLRGFLEILREPYREDGAQGRNDFYSRGMFVIDELRLACPEVADWCISILRDPEHFSSHVNYACDLLSGMALTREQQAKLVRYDDHFLDEGFPAPEMYGKQGHSAVEVADRLRSDLQMSQDFEELGPLLEITAPTDQDVQMLVASLDRGWASRRELALDRIGKHGIDTTTVRAAVSRATVDCDEFVRAKAEKLIASNGW